jgi:tetratricopeptide (TPR) repeat protein
MRCRVLRGSECVDRAAGARRLRTARAYAALVIVALITSAARADDPHVGAQAAGVTDVHSAGLEPSDAADDSQRRVEQLVRQLGSPSYTLRRAAAKELRQIGPEAFDQLFGATDDVDPEIAASARYLLQQIPIHWTRSDDSPLVRRIMRSFGDGTEDDRLPYVAALAQLPAGQGVAALCRIARFERSPLVSRAAALAVIRPDERSESTQAVDPDVVERELGRSTRVASVWLRQWLAQQRDPAASLSGWLRLVDEESERLARNDSQTSGDIVLGLLWNMVSLYDQLGQPQPMMETVDRMVALETDDPQQTEIDLLQWFADHKSWDALDQFLAKHQRQLDRDKRPLYVAALARVRQGKPQLAEELAARAAKLDSLESLGSLRMALELYVRGQFEWSVREYHNAIDDRPEGSLEAMPARVYLADMLHDHQQDEQAAEALKPLVTEIEGKGDASELYERVRQFSAKREDLRLPPLPERESVVARYHFYRACDAEQRHDWAKQREELQQAIKHDETDADVVIAMYHVPEADEAWRAETRKRIQSLSHLFQQQIDEAPNDQSTAVACNQWAWLVANTEGDYDKAVRYSRRSLELVPDTPSFLDTLGRCCYAAGDIDSAVKYQRQAIEAMPYLQVMQRQLAMFEKALAEKGARSE